MRHSSRLFIAFITFTASSLLGGSALAQCRAPEVVRGADKFNDLVCRAFKASQSKDDEKALALLLAASQQPVLESPNIRLLRPIARTYGKLGRFSQSDLYLKYDNLSILWMIGIVRCKQASNSDEEALFQDGKALISDEAKHMAVVLCGPVFDELSYFQDRDTASFIPAAKAILEHASVREEIERMRHKQSSDRR